VCEELISVLTLISEQLIIDIMKLTIITFASLSCIVLSGAQAVCAQAPSDDSSATISSAPASVLAVPFVQVPLPASPQPKKQPSGLADIVRARFPLSIGFEELGAGWRQVNWYGATYFTKGERVSSMRWSILSRIARLRLQCARPHRACYVAYLTRGVTVAAGTRCRSRS
jgi:hypothetical protein